MLSRQKQNRIVAGIIMVLSVAGVLHAGQVLTVADFSRADVGKTPPQYWEALTFKKITAHTIYEVVKDQGRTVIKAQSHASASGLIRKIRIDLKKYPVIQWQWKITDIYKKGDVTSKSGDDYPARIYVAFEYDPGRVGIWEKAKFETIRLIHGQYPPASSMSYIWANHAPEGTRISNPYTKRVMMIAVQSGVNKAGTWVTEERNIYQDYVDSFGHPPPMTSGVAIMTDSDNTGEAATAFYGDILFKSSPGAAMP